MSEVSGAGASVTVQLDVPARMRDGTILRANVYRPAGDGPWPTLLTRTPYEKDATVEDGAIDPVHAARRGFMVAVQDTRGRFASDGEWTPFRFEREDGHDSVEWAARLPGSNGRVGMYGESYCGNTQWMAAAQAPPSLSAIAPTVTWSDPLDGLFARGGAIELGLTVAWTLETGAGYIGRLSISEDERERRFESILDDYDRLAEDGYWQLPVDDMALLARHKLPELGSIRLLRDRGVLDWCTVIGHHDRVNVPTLHTGGWHDIFVQGTLDNYMAMAELGAPARLVVGPWAHMPPMADPIGGLCFGLRAGRAGAPAHADGNVNDLQLAWLHRHLAGGADGEQVDAQAPVRIFVMGRNVWRDETAWPLARARTEQWFLGGGGTLRPGDPASDRLESTEFVYDPADPVPTLGGQTVMAPTFPPGPFDQAPVEARPDVCVFTSEPLQSDLEVTGRVRVVLHAQSSAVSTDWVARLCDVHPDGRSFNLCDGIVRIFEGADASQRVEIDLWSTSNVFLAGHSLRVHVTSSSFPRWDRNLNTGDQGQAHMQVARQRIHHCSERPSWIELPVVP
jgi:putative CocE/NonD family hydrolase